MSTEAPPSRRHLPSAERRAQILEAALRCFGEKGYHEATMDDLVKASGLSKGSLYWHFRSKEDLFLALFEAISEQVLAELRGIGSRDEPILEGLRLQGADTLALLGSALAMTRAWIEFFLHPRARRRLAALYARVRQATAELLRLGIERGEVREVAVESAAAGLVAAIEGLLIQAFVEPEFDARRQWDAIFEVFARGLAGGAGPEGEDRT